MASTMEVENEPFERCPECGMTLAGVGDRPGAYSRAALWWTVAAFVAVYVVVLAVVAATR